MKKLLLIVIFLLFGCDKELQTVEEMTDAGTDAGDEVDTSEVVETYPTENWGYKPAVRSQGGLLSKGQGDTLPYIDTGGGGDALAEQIWQSEAELVPLVWSVLDCPPCDMLYRDLPSGFVLLLGTSWDHAASLQQRYPQLVFDADLMWQYGIPWELDHWPETVRAYPTVQMVAPANMEISFEQIGYIDKKTQDEEYLRKYKTWKGEKR